MTVHLSRDILQIVSGINVQAATTPVWSLTFYQTALFLYRVLGYPIVGASGINLDTTRRVLNISAVNYGIPFQLTTATAHGLSIGSSHAIQVTGAVGLNGAWNAIATGANTLEVRGFASSGSGGQITTGPLYASGLVADGYGAGINFGVGFLYEVSVPAGVTVDPANVNKLLVLKSTRFPTKNSGIFRITGVNIGANRYIIDYRSTEAPPVEAANSMDWWIYESENVMANQLHIDSFWNPSSPNISAATNTSPVTITGNFGNGCHNLFTGQRVTITGALGNTAINGSWVVTVLTPTTFQLNGSTGNGTYTVSSGSFFKEGYPGSGLSASPRIIFQTPHSTGWQLRLSLEPTGGNLPPISVTTGFSGNSSGDFPVAGPQTHAPSFLNVNPRTTATFNATVPGQGDSTIGQRLTLVGETNGQYVAMFTRPLSGGRLYGFNIVGVPDNEPIPTPINEERVFAYGSTMGPSAANQEPGGTLLRIATQFGNVGVTMRNGAPKFMALTGWANLDGTNVTTPIFNSNAGDCPFTGTTEILPIELWAATYADPSLSPGAVPPFQFDQSYMGTSPLFRIGRSNFSSVPTLTTEEVTSRTVTSASNTNPIQITTSATNSLVTGQTVTVSGVTGNTAANGTWVITRINGTTFSLNGSVGNGAYVSGGTVNGCAGWIHLTNGLYMMWNGPSGITA